MSRSLRFNQLTFELPQPGTCTAVPPRGRYSTSSKWTSLSECAISMTAPGNASENDASPQARSGGIRSFDGTCMAWIEVV